MPSRRVRRVLFRLLQIIACAAGLALAAIVVFTVSCRSRQLLFEPTPESLQHPAQAAGIKNYNRPEVDTFYTYPEWYIVWSYQAKADFQRNHLPSGYSYFGDIGQFWHGYCSVYSFTRSRYPLATGDHIMLAVIGSSFTVEYTLKGLYEKTIGRLSEWTSHHELVAEDAYAAQVAEDYATFVHVRPFYEYSFAHALHNLWFGTPFRSQHLLRTLERRAWLSLDYSFEAAYSELIELGTHATYGFEDTTTAAWIEFPPQEKAHMVSLVPSMKFVRELGEGEAIVEIPRYQEFTADAQKLLQAGVRFHQIVGNQLIVVSAIAPGNWTNTVPNLQLLLAQPMLTDRAKTRVVLLCPVPHLHLVIPLLQSGGLTIEHMYDY
jgi:hypothetical protein